MVRRKSVKPQWKSLKKRQFKSGRKQSRRKNKRTRRKMRGGEIDGKLLAVFFDKTLETCLKACELLQPFIQRVYNLLNYEYLSEDGKNQIQDIKDEYDKVKIEQQMQKTKLNDTDVFTITDGMVQYILRKHLFKIDDSLTNPTDFVGEENIKVIEPDDQTEDDKKNKYSLIQGTNEAIDIPSMFTNQITGAITEIKNLNINNQILNNYTIFVDPIDGTAEYAGTDKRSKEEKEEEKWPIGGKGEQATIMIGFADRQTKRSTAGIVYRPVYNNKDQQGTYAYGYYIDDKYKKINKDHIDVITTVEEDHTRFITSNGDISNFSLCLINKVNEHDSCLTKKNSKDKDVVQLENKTDRVQSGGAGNKILMLLENKADIYLSDRGVSRWDTCAGEAILRASGGGLYKLTDYIASGELKEYTYKKADYKDKKENPNVNADANRSAKASKYNRVMPNTEGLDPNLYTSNSTSNLCGLIAFTGDKKDKVLAKIQAKIKDVTYKPQYD